MDLPFPFTAGPFDSDEEFQAFARAEQAEAHDGGFVAHVSRAEKDDGLHAEVTYSEPERSAGGAAAIAAGAAAGAAVGGVVGPVTAAAGAVAGMVAAAFVLGNLSRRFEVGNRGPETVSTGAGDAGGASYGLYQMTSKPNGGTVAAFIKTLPPALGAAFAGKASGTPEFTQAWKQLAATHGKEFAQAQHAYIESTHYKPCLQKVLASAGIDLDARSNTLRDVIWSTAVQHGPGGSASIIGACCQSLARPGAPKPQDGSRYDHALIDAIYAERGRKDANGTMVHFSRNSPNVQTGVANRFVEERKLALRALGA